MIEVGGYSRSLEMLYAFSSNNHQISTRQQRLSTGNAINRAEEDAAGISIAARLESRIRGQAQALANIEDAKSLLNIKEQNLTSVQEILITMQEKATQAANDTLDSQARDLVTRQLQSLAAEITTTLTTASYGDVSLNTSSAFTFQVGEEASESFVVENSDEQAETLSLGTLNDGIASWDALSGTGYIMYTETDIFTRFGANPGFNTAENLVAVVNQGGQWYWSSWGGLTAFTPENSDQLLAEVDFDSDTVVNLEGTETTIEGISAGYESGDLVITPNQFGTPPAGSPEDFHVQGTSVVIPPPTLADELTFSAAQLTVSTAAAARSLMGSVESALETLNTEIQAIGEYQQMLTLKSEFLSTKRINASQAKSRIMDADFAKEQIELAKLEILQNTGASSLSQAVSDNNLVLQLL
ncbi:MAG: flagellin [Bacteroidota bacterium]